MSFLLLLNVFSSTKLEKRTEQILPGSEGLGGVGRERKRRAGVRNDPKNICTYE
jgi:hypothetical protein